MIWLYGLDLSNIEIYLIYCRLTELFCTAKLRNNVRASDVKCPQAGKSLAKKFRFGASNPHSNLGANLNPAERGRNA